MEKQAEKIQKIKGRATNFLDEFKAFALKGSVLDLAIGIVVGTAFNSIVNSLVADVIMPTIAAIFGQPDFSAIVLGPVKIGNFINSIVNFLIIALSVFVALKFIMRWMPKKGEKEAA